MCGLAELLLDPYYRTLVGFGALIEKEWCAFGFQFAKRCGQGDGTPDSDQHSPIFLLWLDCIWQVMQQQPGAFEFNEALLIALADQVHGCRFGTFLCNCVREREGLELAYRTSPAFAWVLAERGRFTNPAYARVEATLYPNCNPKNIRCVKPKLLQSCCFTSHRPGQSAQVLRPVWCSDTDHPSLSLSLLCLHTLLRCAQSLGGVLPSLGHHASASA